ncbi:MAG: hypothetical protein HRT44_10135, partial [Bdellovibrionales bacterium]|nr:hypothetical protein [Bdellovibrionales bacterium]NQZ19599.1 hypothetical protein [Bdellovibrionales bacterium]
EMVEEIRNREFTTNWSQYPHVEVRLKDLDDTDADELYDWTEVGRRDTNSDGSLVLLDRSRNGEVETFRSYLRTALKEYQCSLVPVETDADYSTEMAEFIGPETSFCSGRVRRWMQYKRCEMDMRIKHNPADYEVNCPEELME